MDILNQQIKDLEVSENDIIHFKEGIPGFEDFKNYVLLQDDDMSFLMYLQSIDEEFPSFVVVDPYSVLQNYEPVLAQSDMDYFDCSGEDLKFLLVTVLPKDLHDTVVNLKSPIVIDFKSNNAKQVILENKEYPIRYRLFD